MIPDYVWFIFGICTIIFFLYKIYEELVIFPRQAEEIHGNNYDAFRSETETEDKK